MSQVRERSGDRCQCKWAAKQDREDDGETPSGDTHLGNRGISGLEHVVGRCA